MRHQGCGLRLVGALFSLLLAVLVIGAVAFVFLRSEGGSLGTFFSSLTNIASLGSRTIIRPVVPLTAGGDGRSPDLLIVNFQLSGSPITEALSTPDAATLNRGIPVLLTVTEVQNGRRVVRWERQVGTDEGGQQINYTFDETAVYVTINNELLALDLQTGQQKWGVPLTDAVDGLCAHCIEVAGDKIVLLTVDSTLQTFSTRNGQSLWAIRLNNAQRPFSAKTISQFVVTNGQVAILDDVKTDTGIPVWALLLIDAETGKIRSQLSPSCDMPTPLSDGLSEVGQTVEGVIETADNAPTEITNALGQLTNALEEVNSLALSSFLNGGLDTQSTILVDNSQDALYFTLGGLSSQRCLQRWQISTGQPLWSASLPQGFRQDVLLTGGLYRPEDFSYQVSGDKNFYLSLSQSSADPSMILVLDQATGSPVFTLEQLDYQVMPLAEVGDILFTRGTRIRGTKRDEIWGVNITSGQIVWQHPLQADNLLRLNSSFGVNWDYHLTSRGLAVIQLLPDPDRVIAQVLTTDGQVLSEATNNVGDDFWQSTVWTDDQAFMAIRDLFAVDLSSGQTTREWP